MLARLGRPAQLALFLVLVSLVAGPAAALEQSDAQRYVACTRLVDADPEAALEEAAGWAESVAMGEAASQAARHCLSLALVAVGEYGTAAEGMSRLADEMVAFPDRRLALLRQAGQAWLLADAPQPARAAFDAALALVPDDPALLVDRARASAAEEDYWQAIDDLDRSLTLAPDQADALVFRGSAYRLLDVPELAATDIERALAVEPDNVDALLEQGILLGRDDEIEAARRVWRRILDLAPDSAAASAARRNLEITEGAGAQPE